MNLLELFIISVGLSMDAFAVSVCSGVTMPRVTVKKSLIVGGIILVLMGFKISLEYMGVISL